MKLIVKLTAAETVKSFDGLGLAAELSALLASKVKHTYRFPLFNLARGSNWLLPHKYQWFRLKSCYTFGKLYWSLGLFNIECSHIVHEAIDLLFSHEDGQIERGLHVTKIVMKDGREIVDYNEIEAIIECDDESVINYSESEIEIGDAF